MTTTTERGTWVAPANRVTWTPPGFEHSHRFYGNTDARLLTIPAGECRELAPRPSVFAVSRLFHADLGMSFHRWRTILRIQHAESLARSWKSTAATTSKTGGMPVSSMPAVCAYSGGGEPKRSSRRWATIPPIRRCRCAGWMFSPMSHGRLYLVGDAAHLISPMSAEGMSLALHDADALARAVVGYVGDGDSSLLESYSDTCLRHTWERQASAVWMTETMHDSGDASYEGEFRKQIARANRETLVQPRTTL